MIKVEISKFAQEVFEETIQSLPENLKNRVGILSSSTGDEAYCNFIQKYTFDEKPAGIYKMIRLDAEINSNDTFFLLNDYQIDSPNMDWWSNKLEEYKQFHPTVRAFEFDESGGAFYSFTDAMDFKEWAEATKKIEVINDDVLFDTSKTIKTGDMNVWEELKRVTGNNPEYLAVVRGEKGLESFSTGKDAGKTLMEKEVSKYRHSPYVPDKRIEVFEIRKNKNSTCFSQSEIGPVEEFMKTNKMEILKISPLREEIYVTDPARRVFSFNDFCKQQESMADIFVGKTDVLENYDKIYEKLRNLGWTNISGLIQDRIGMSDSNRLERIFKSHFDNVDRAVGDSDPFYKKYGFNHEVVASVESGDILAARKQAASSLSQLDDDSYLQAIGKTYCMDDIDRLQGLADNVCEIDISLCDDFQDLFYEKYDITLDELYAGRIYRSLERPVESDFYNYPGVPESLDESAYQTAIKMYDRDVTDNLPDYNSLNEKINNAIKSINQIENDIVGKIKYLGFGGDVAEVMEYDDKEKYLKAIKDELYCNPDGFRAYTISKDPELRKSVDDLYYGECGVDNPHSIEYYKDISTRKGVDKSIETGNLKNNMDLVAPQLNTQALATEKALAEFETGLWEGGHIDLAEFVAYYRRDFAANTQGVMSPGTELFDSQKYSLKADIIVDPNLLNREGLVYKVDSLTLFEKNTGKSWDASPVLDNLAKENIDLLKLNKNQLKELVSCNRLTIPDRGKIALKKTAEYIGESSRKITIVLNKSASLAFSSVFKFGKIKGLVDDMTK